MLTANAVPMGCPSGLRSEGGTLISLVSCGGLSAGLSAIVVVAADPALSRTATRVTRSAGRSTSRSSETYPSSSSVTLCAPGGTENRPSDLPSSFPSKAILAPCGSVWT